MNKVVKLSVNNGIACVAMEEKQGRNTFTNAFVNEMIEVFTYINANRDIKVVIVYGYDNYFSCGATKENLLSLCESNSGVNNDKHTFVELHLYDMLITCRVPVISAMQGHALGGGLVFGCSADVIIMAEECIYSTNFMKYGFTPGMGATFIIPYKLGETLGTEMLFSAGNYYGAELKQRGANAQIVSKGEVMKTALKIAEEIAEKPVLPLELLKNRIRENVKPILAKAVESELKMHEMTFGQPDVLSRINSLIP